MSKRIICKTCGNQIPKTAKVCPFCGKKQHKNVGPACAIVAIIAIVLIIVVVLVSGNNSSPTQVDALNIDSSAQGHIPNETEKLIYEDNGISIYFLGFEIAPSPAIGYYVNLRIENTSDTDRTIQVQDVSADGIMVPFANAIFSGNVLAGKTLNDHIWITNTEQLGINELLNSVELKFVVYDSDDLSNGAISDTITIE